MAARKRSRKGSNNDLFRGYCIVLTLYENLHSSYMNSKLFFRLETLLRIISLLQCQCLLLLLHQICFLAPDTVLCRFFI